MCGGVGVFESLRAIVAPPSVTSLLHQIPQAMADCVDQEIKTSVSRYDKAPQNTQLPSFSAGMDSRNCGGAVWNECVGMEVLPAPSIASEEQLDSPTKKSMPRILSIRPFCPDVDKSLKNPCSLLLSASPDHDLGVSNLSTVPAEKRSGKSSIFCTLSPTNVYEPEAQDPPFANFLKACFRCRRCLGFGTDIYMYRGDMAFCSNDCRCEYMLEENRSERVQHHSSTRASREEVDRPAVTEKVSVHAPMISVLG
ncbi:hypothetical protein KP509_18G047200 [Ceratopteris richardii]|uniref:FLZ-type domain-containing protein n=1 Tax=Ceratopteris richardii TaxID=49495 RepID=A0A8T2SSJ7_CERRI|nr:hypothetical protein KP509_18G047200 [Ceratopteris richardii]